MPALSAFTLLLIVDGYHVILMADFPESLLLVSAEYSLLGKKEHKLQHAKKTFSKYTLTAPFMTKNLRKTLIHCFVKKKTKQNKNNQKRHTIDYCKQMPASLFIFVVIWQHLFIYLFIFYLQYNLGYLVSQPTGLSPCALVKLSSQ